MESLVEGIGDEVLWALGFGLLIAVLSLAWLSTGVRPLWSADSVWYVQLQTWPTRRILQVLHIQPRDATPAAQSRGGGGERAVEAESADQGASTRTIQLEPREVEELGRSADIEDLPTRATPVLADPPSPAQQSLPSATSSDAEETQSPETPSQSSSTRIRLKFLDETQRWVEAALGRSVADFKRRHFPSESAQGKVIRLIYQGQLLRDEGRSLESYGLAEGAVLHCHVSNTPLSQSSAGGGGGGGGLGVGGGGGGGVVGGGGGGGAGEEALGGIPGRYLHLFLAAKLLGLWALWISFPDYFDLTASAAMLVLSLAAVVTAFYYLRPQPNPQPPPPPPAPHEPAAEIG